MYHPLIIFILTYYTILCALRYNVGVDYPTYLYEYENYRKYTTYEGVNNFEIGWAWFSWKLSCNNISYTIYFGIIAFMQLFILLSAFKRKVFLLPSLILAFFFGCFFLDFQNVIRQNIVMTIFLYYVFNHKEISIWKAVLLFIFCCLIHKSSPIMILLLPLIYIEKTPSFEFKLAPLIFIICAYIGSKYDLFSLLFSNIFILQAIMDSEYNNYLDDSYMAMGMNNSMGIGFLLKFMMDFLVIFSGIKMSRYFINDKAFLICFRFFYLGKCLKYLFPTSIVLGRPILYLTIFTLPILAYYYYYIYHTSTLKLTFESCKNLIVIMLTIVLFFANYFLNSEGYMSEFHFVWEK